MHQSWGRPASRRPPFAAPAILHACSLLPVDVPHQGLPQPARTGSGPSPFAASRGAVSIHEGRERTRGRQGARRSGHVRVPVFNACGQDRLLSLSPRERSRPRRVQCGGYRREKILLPRPRQARKLVHATRRRSGIWGFWLFFQKNYFRFRFY